MLGIFVAIFMVFVFWASGSAISYLCRLRLNNTFINIGVGFFTYFAIISICIFPLQIISVIPYLYFLYVLLIVTVVYILITLTLIRFWLTRKIFSTDVLIFASLFAIIYFFDLWLNMQETSKNQYNIFKNSLSVLYWIKDLQVSLFGDILTGDLKFKNIQSWYTFQLMILIVTGQLSSFDQNKEAIFSNIYINFNLIIDVSLSAALVLYASLAIGRKKNLISSVLFTMLNCLFFCGFKYLIARNNFTIWNEDIYFIYLVAFIVLMLYDYVITVKRSKNHPLLIGLILSSYIAFSWAFSYQILFLVYSILFILQIWLRNTFVKELYKISLLFVVDFIFFNIIEKLYLLSLIYTSVILLFSSILYWMNKNYNIVVNFETTLNNKRGFSILLLPAIIIIASIFIGLTKKSSDLFLISTQEMSIFYPWLSIYFKSNVLTVSYLFSYILLGLSLIWVFHRHNKFWGGIKMPIDIFVINYLTFYNPYSIRTFKTLIYNDLELANGAVLIVALYVIILWASSKFYTYASSLLKIKSIRKKRFINQIEIRRY